MVLLLIMDKCCIVVVHIVSSSMNLVIEESDMVPQLSKTMADHELLHLMNDHDLRLLIILSFRQI